MPGNALDYNDLWGKYKQHQRAVSADARQNLVAVTLKKASAALASALVLANVSSVAGDTVQVTRLGQTGVDGTFYPALAGVARTLVANDPVLLVRLGASYVVVGKVQSGSASAALGTATLPALAATTTGTITVSDTRTGPGGLILLSAINNNGDSTAGRGVSVWLESWTAGSSFIVGYRSAAAMGRAWEVAYKIYG